MLRKLIVSAVGLLMMGTSLLANANPDLMIRNKTQCYSTLVTNHGACSTILGSDIGVANPNSDHPVAGKYVRIACMLNQHNCTADLYLTNNCKGPAVATVTFDIDTGIKTVQNHNSDFNVTVSSTAPFDATISGGPATADGCPKN